MSFTDEYLALQNKKKKKKKEEQKTTTKSTGHSFTDEYLAKRSTAKEEDIAPVFVNKTAGLYSNPEKFIAPVTRITGTTKKEEDERKWFQKGEFEDGYQLGDITKTILGTKTDISENLLTGVLGMGEKAVDAGAYIVGGVGGLLGADKFQEKTKKFIQKDLYNEENIAKKIIGVSASSMLNDMIGVDSEGSSVLGEKSDALVQSAGQLAGTLGLQAVGVPWFVTSGVVGFGSEAENALNQGASYGRAGMSAAISAGAEILTEKLFGGSGLGETGLIAVDRLTKGITNKAVKALADYGVDILAEGSEEVISEFMSNLGSSLYKEKKLGEILFSEEAIDGYIESFIGGGVLGGVMNASNAISSVKSGRDYRSGLSVNEQKVIDKVVEDRIAEAEKNGKLTNKQKNKIYDEIVRKLEKGYISTDTIEEVLGGESYSAFKGEYDAFFGGETYKAYKDTVASEEAQIKEIEAQIKELEEAPNTVGNSKKYDALQAQIEEIKNSAKRSELKAQLDSEAARIGEIRNQLRTNVSEMVKDSRLFESYRELARSHEKYTADVSKYTNEHARKTIQNIMDSGVAVNTNEFHEFADWLAKISEDKGMSFTTTDTERLKGTRYYHEGYITNGFIDENGNVTLNMDSANAGQVTVGHEITHVLEGTEFYGELKKAVQNYAVSKLGQDAFNTRLEETKTRYEGKGDPDKELTADLIGEYLFTDTDFINNLSVQHRNVFQKIYDEIKYLCKVATAGSKEARELEKVKRAFEKAYQESGKTEGTKYSVSDVKDELFERLSAKRKELNESSWLQDDIEDSEEYNALIKEIVSSGASPEALAKYKEWDAKTGYSALVEKNKQLAKEARELAAQHDKAVRESWVADEAKAIAKSGLTEADYFRKQAVKEFGYTPYFYDAGYITTNGKMLNFSGEKGKHFGSRGQDHRAIGTIYADTDGTNALNRFVKDGNIRIMAESPGIDISATTEPTKEQYATIRKFASEYSDKGYFSIDLTGEDGRVVGSLTYQNRINPTRIVNDIKHYYATGEIREQSSLNQFRYSLSDSDGKQLTKEQQEYFKDSKMRDEKGNLKVMYHGSQDAGFHVFDARMSDDDTSFFFVDRNDVAASYSGTTETYEARTIRTVEDMNNFLAEIDYDHYKAVERNGKFVLLENNEDVATKDTMQEIYEEFCWYEGIGDGDANYKVYLNLKNPLVIDALENQWNDLVPPDGSDSRWKTRDYAQYAKKNGYDGVIFKDIVDMGPFDGGYYQPSTVAIAFDSNQIKSVANEKPTADKDIRYSLSDSEGRKLSDGQSEYFKDSKAKDENGRLQVVYHGTRNKDFTVFKRNANFYTDSKAMAESYAPSGAMYEGYVNITKPFVIDAKGEKWSGIAIDGELKNLLESYGSSTFKERGKWRTSTADIVAAISDMVDEGEADYDGVIIRNVDDTGSYYKGSGKNIGTDYITFSSNQFKNIDNQTPTSDPDIRFSLSKPVEETDRLVAVHNKSVNGVMRMLERNGVPFPSVAIKKSGAPHEGFGECSVVFPRSTIDPEANRWNKLYSNDAWTPTEPRTEYDVGDTYKYKKLFENMLGTDIYQALRGSSYLDSDELAKEIGSSKGNVFDAVKRLGVVKYGYLQSIGQRPEAGTKQKTLDGFGKYKNDQLLAVFDAVDGEAIRNASYDDTEILQQIADALNEQFVEQIPADKKESVFKLFGKKPLYTADNINIYAIKDAYDAWEAAGRTIPTEIDYYSLDNALRSNKDIEEDANYQRWVEDIFDGVIKDSGIPNGKDYYTPSGNRRSFKQLHVPATLENIVQQMRKENETGVGVLGGINLRGAATKTYDTVEDMRKDSGKLLGTHIDDDVYDSYMNGFHERLHGLSSRAAKRDGWEAKNTAEEILLEAVRDAKTKASMNTKLRKEADWINYDAALVEDLWQLKQDVQNMPAPYFEAKPRRIVSPYEAAAYIIPDNAPAKLFDGLNQKGLPYKTYKAGDEADRLRVLNGLLEEQPDLRFSLSREGEQVAPNGLSPLNKFKYQEEIAPVSNTDFNTQPVSNTDSNTPNALDSDMFPDDLAPMADDPERFDSLTDADMPPEMDAPYTEDGEVTVDDPFEERDWYKVGNRKVNAYMYENPEVKPFFQEEAAMLLAELNDTIKGEKWYNDDLYYETNGEQGFGGTKRLTSDSIAEMLDGWGMSYADIEKGLNAILEDNGAENIAAAKKIEFMLNDRLLNGYKDFYSHSMTPPNEEYINLLNEKQITEYSKEAFDRFMETADSYAPPTEDIAPVAKPAKRSPYMAESAPVEKYEAIRPKREKQPRMARATPEEQARAEIMVEEPKVNKRKNSLWNWAKVNLIDPGTVFETLSLKSGNPELQARHSAIKRAESRAQRLMEKGNGMTSSLKSIREAVEKTGKTGQFYAYLYHMHNADRMTLEDRYDDVENKPVFGSSITAHISNLEVAELEKRNPEFKRLAREVYNYMGYLREMLVDGGVISEETAELWSEMYPHYVPIRREGHDGLNINVPLDTGRTGINAPIKRATGGNSNILPLFDTMGQRTIQTFKAVAKNRFGVELKNTLGTTIDRAAAGLDEVIEGVDTHEELLKEGKHGMSPTFTVFENGEKVTFEITQEMYDAMKPKSGAANINIKALNRLNDVRRGLITEYNPVFAITNPIKDLQDVLINSKHPARTYLNMPNAIKELLGNGQWYQEYMDNGGEQNTYFEGETNTFVKEKSTLRKVVGFPVDKLGQVNNFIEKVPRLAEYIASRKMGRSVDVSMLDAARVTTDFSAGGHIVKMMNRNGFTFLNASVQGAVQQVRNIREARYNGFKGWAQLAGKTVAAGLPAILLNHLLWEDDEEYEELSDYVKQGYYIVGKTEDGKFIRLPKGRTVAVIQNAFEQMENLITGNDEADLGTFAELAISNLAPNNPLDNNIIAPIAQAISNKTWYGEDLVPTRLQDLPAAEQYDESTDAISRWLGERTPFSPYKINYVLDQYSGGVGDTFLPMLTPEAESGDDTLVGNLLAPLKDKFTTDAVMNNQNVSDFYDKKDELAVNANAAEATEEDVLMSKYINSVNAEMSKLYAEKREIQNSDLPDAEKYAAVRDVQKQIVELSKEGLNSYGKVSFEDDYREGGNYARVNDRLYKQNDEGVWTKLSDEQVTKYEVTKAAGNSSYATDGTNHYRWYVPGEDASEDTKPGWRKVTDKELEKQNEVTKGLGISPETYWSNREEYSYAYEHPENYAVAKAVGGYEAYRSYSSELYDIKADKDSSGKSISGSRKEKVWDYVNGLDIEYGEKLILFKNEYNADDDYNYEIIDYLNSREDISFEEMATILKKLGFTVSADGDISW